MKMFFASYFSPISPYKYSYSKYTENKEDTINILLLI